MSTAPGVDGSAGGAARGHLLSPAHWLGQWRSSQLVRPRLISLLHLLSGNFGGMLIMMASLAIATHALGQSDFGVMVLVLAICRVCERLIRFESWQPLIRFVAAEEVAGDKDRLASLYAYGLLLDFVSAVVAAIMSVCVAWVAGGVLGLDHQHVYLVAIYAVAIACNLRGMASAALRLYGKFRILAYIQLASFVVRLGLAAGLLLAGIGLTGFVLVWTVSQVFDAVLFNAVGLRTLREAGLPSPLRADIRGLNRKFPGFLRFAVSTNVSSTMRTMTHEMDTLLVSSFAGASAAGLYYLSRRIANVAQTAGDMIQTVIYPDLARLWTQVGPNAMGRLVMILQAALALLAIGALGACLILGEPVLKLAFGPGFAATYPMLMMQLVAVLLVLHGAPARSALLAMNRPTYVLVSAGIATACFFLVAWQAIPRLGGIGANLAHIAFGLVTVILLDLAFWRGLREGRSPEDRPKQEAET